MESLAASLAATRHNEKDEIALRNAYKRLIKSHSRKDAGLEARADAMFHLAIAEAAHNVVLLHVMRSLFSLLGRSIRYNLENLYTQPGMFELLRDQHYHLLQAILKRDPKAAMAASEHHISHVEHTLSQLDLVRQRVARSTRRSAGLVAV